jgi:hypothetical protein
VHKIHNDGDASNNQAKEWKKAQQKQHTKSNKRQQV